MSEDQLISTPSMFGETGNLIIERELGRGGMGAVYMGRDKMLDRPIALKAMLREYGSDVEFVEKFKKEAQAAARLIHPNIAQIYSYGIYDGIPYIVMELVAGGSLEQLMRISGKNTDVPRVMKICEQIAQALRCASDQGFVHGDVKPENILLDANGNAKLVDFGLAAMQKDTDEIWGTPYYIAPEKVRKGSVDYRADMFSLGATLYHALCGVAPYEGDDATAVVKKRFEGLPKKPSELREGISAQVDSLVMKMLEEDPANRYPTFEALLEDFRKVLTIGLTTTSAITAPEEETAPAAQPSTMKTGSGKRIVLKSKKKMVLKPKTHAEEDPEENEDEENQGEEESSNKSGKKMLKKGKLKHKISNGSDDGYDDEEEEGGSVGGKVLLVIGAIILTIGLVAGGLIWYQVSDKKAREAELQAQIEKGVSSAHDSLAKTKSAAIKFADEFDQFALEAVSDCQRPTDKLRQILGDVYAVSVLDLLKPPETKELLDAIASTNIVVAPIEEATTNAIDAAITTNLTEVATANAQALETATKSLDGAMKAVPKFRAPVDDEADPNSPEGEKYLAEKKKWEEEQKAKIEAAKKEAIAGEQKPTEEAKDAPTVDADGKKTEVPAVVRDVNELWVKAYSCQAAAIRIRTKITTLIADIEEAEKFVCTDEQSMRKLVEKSNELKGRYDEIKGSGDVTVVQKAKGFINSRGRKSVDETVRKLREDAAQKARDDAKKARLEAEKKRQEDMAAAKLKKIEEETVKAKECFDKIVADGMIRQLNWKGAYRLLANLEIETAEGQLEVKKHKSKIECMEEMQNILMKGLKDYKFTRGSKDAKINLRGAVVKSLTAEKITIQRKGRPTTDDVLWQNFYVKYNNSLDEVVNYCIIKSGTPGNEAPRLSKLKRFNAIMGTAFILRIVCAENPTAAGHAEKLVKDAVKSFPAKFKDAKEFFPDIDFSDVEKEIEAENI